jgi:hypothetical protein
VNTRLFSVLVFVVLLSSCGSRQPQTENTAAVTNTGEVNTPLSSFSQDIQSQVKSLNLGRGEKTLVPITLRNTGTSILATVGKDPITISYKWFDHGKTLPIEGERTSLPGPLKPGDSVDIKVNVVAPETPGDLVLKVTLVQEGVTWFMTAGAKPLELPVTVH